MSGLVVSVWGPTGAPGRTTVAIGLATELCLRGMSVVLVDSDTYGGSVAGYLELFDEAPGFLAACRLADQGKFEVAHLERLGHRLILNDGNLTVLTGMTNPSRWPELTRQRVRAGLDELRSRFDVVVVDCGFNLEEDEEITSDLLAPRRNQATVACLRSSTAVVAVGNAEVVGLARYIHALDQLAVCAENAAVLHVVNRIRRHPGVVGGAGQTVRKTLYRFAGLEQVYLIDEDVKGCDAALVAAMPIQIASPSSPVVKQISQLASGLMEVCASRATSPDAKVMEPAAG